MLTTSIKVSINDRGKVFVLKATVKGLTLTKAKLVEFIVQTKNYKIGLPWWLSGKASACQCRRHRLDLWSGENPTCHGVTKPVGRSYRACALELESQNYWSPRALEPLPCDGRSRHSGQPALQPDGNPAERSWRKALSQRRPRTAKHTQINTIIFKIMNNL